MEKIKIILAFAFIFILLSSFVNAEVIINGYSQVNPITSNTTNQFVTAVFDDSSIDNTGKHKPIEVTITALHQYGFPFDFVGINITGCNLTITHHQNNYDADGNLVNTTISATTYALGSFGGGNNYPATIYNKDMLDLNLECYYTDQPNDTILQRVNGEDIANIWFDMPSFSCKKCEKLDYEEVVDAYLEARAYSTSYLQIFDNFTDFSNNNYEVWLFIYWILKIFLYIVGASLVFIAGFWVYNFLKKMSERIG
jgi:hypothetical protein